MTVRLWRPAWIARPMPREGPQDALKTSQLRVRVWQSADVVDSVLAHYERLDDEIRNRLPLKRVWMIADTGV
jgi:predicted Mrr-cat superfamily restriction endonuclease